MILCTSTGEGLRRRRRKEEKEKKEGVGGGSWGPRGSLQCFQVCFKNNVFFKKDNVVLSKEAQFLIKLFLSLGCLGAPSCPPPHYVYVSILLLIVHTLCVIMYMQVSSSSLCICKCPPFITRLRLL
jgi:hypothetical protein